MRLYDYPVTGRVSTRCCIMLHDITRKPEHKGKVDRPMDLNESLYLVSQCTYSIISTLVELTS